MIKQNIEREQGTSWITVETHSRWFSSLNLAREKKNNNYDDFRLLIKVYSW